MRTTFEWLTARPIAHRGYHDMGLASAGRRIENTMAAAEAAIARNFAIECDLQPTADGSVIVFHDDTLDRLTNLTGPVAAKTLADAISYSGRGVTVVEERDLWDMPIVLMLLLGCGGAEWAYRRARGLI